MIAKTLASITRPARKRVSEAVWQYLMKPGQAGWGRKPFDQEELKLLREALVSQNLCCIDGRMVSAFESAFAEAHDVPFAVGSTSGTAAIHLALGALDLEPGDEVITAPITDLGTVIPILSQGCIPVFADIDDTFNIDPVDVERKITPRTRAILAVHLFGNPCDLDALRALATRHRLALIEDCSQAHLAEYRGRLVGTIGDIGCFSFQQSKHMTTGDGGMTITTNRQYFERMKLFADKGYARKGYGARAYLFHAPNYRMTELVGAVGLAQLRKLPDVVARRRELGQYFTDRLSEVAGLTTAPTTPGATHSYWLYPFTVPDTVDVPTFGRTLLADRVHVMAGYTGKPIYLCSESLTRKKTYGTSEWPFTCAPEGVVYEYVEGLCPKAEAALEHLICVPFNESWTRTEVDRVAAAVARALADGPVRSPGKVVAGYAKPAVAISSPSAAPRLRIGIVGCGQMGRWHLNAYAANPAVEVAAFADSNLPSAASFAAEHGGRAYDSHREMLANERLDAVSVCTIPVTHREIVVDALRAGLHVLCEKPLAFSVADAAVMRDVAAASGRLMATAFKFRFFEEVLKARDLVRSNALGSILKVRLMFGGRLDMAGTWYARPELSGGGVVMDNGPHAFDLVRFLFGEVESVSAATAIHQLIDVEDTAHISCDLRGGGTATLDLSWQMPVPSAAYLEIYGQQGTALLDSAGISYRLETWPEWKRLPNLRGIHAAFGQQIDHFITAIRGDLSPVVTPDDGWQSQLLIAAAYQSAERGKPVRVADEVYLNAPGTVHTPASFEPAPAR